MTSSRQVFFILEEDLPCGDLCDVTGVQDATSREGVGGKGGALTLSWVLDWTHNESGYEKSNLKNGTLNSHILYFNVVIYQRKIQLWMQRCKSDFVIGPLLCRLLEWAEMMFQWLVGVRG